MKDSRAENYQSRTAEVNGVKIHYLESGTGKKPLVLIHGFGDTSWMWTPLFDEFGGDFTVITPDMRGLGASSRPAAGYDKKTLAADIHELVRSLGYQKIGLAGHDTGRRRQPAIRDPEIADAGSDHRRRQGDGGRVGSPGEIGGRRRYVNQIRRHRPLAGGTASRGDQSRAEEIF
jgi:hypothetical protein